MRLLFSALPLVGCVVMSLSCRRMGRGGKCAAPAGGEVAALRAEIAQLRTASASKETRP